MRRANAVAQGLVNDGVDSGAIKTGWTGEKDLAVADRQQHAQPGKPPHHDRCGVLKDYQGKGPQAP